jgi:DNA ligase-associated metallophosphoesterase
MYGAVQLLFAGVELRLLPDGGVWWSDTRRLLVADVHLGFSGTAAAQPLIEHEAATLQRIARMLGGCPARELWVLGDLIHTPCRGWSAVEDAWREFRGSYPELHVLLVPGNHDRGAADWSERLQVDVVSPLTTFGELSLVHDPEAAPEHRDTIAGHLHPTCSVSPHGPRRFPCYWLRGRCLILPAISALPGRRKTVPQPHDRVWAIVEDRLQEVSADPTPECADG